MKLDTEALRADLVRFHEMAAAIGLQHVSESTDQLAAAKEEELVSIAADQGWDLGKYILREDNRS